MLNVLRKAKGDIEVLNKKASLLIRNLLMVEQKILYTLANLPNGVDAELASSFVEADSRDLLALREKGLLLRESRFGIMSSWFRLPRPLLNSLRVDSEQVTAAATSLADRFVDRIGSDPNLSPTEVLLELTEEPGGIDFAHDIHQVFVELEYWPEAHALPLLLHQSLFAKGRWYDAFKFWDRLLSHSEFTESEAHEWLRLGKAAQLLSLGEKARECITNANKRNPTLIDKVDSLLLEAAIIKDQGDIARAQEVTALYDKILTLIDGAKQNLAEMRTEEIEESELSERYALTIYTRAIYKHYWLHDLVGAVSDLDHAAAVFNELEETRMKALADCQWVDIWLNSSEVNQDWGEMLNRLINADDIFTSIGGAVGDSAFCNYQIARYFRRKPFSTSAEFTANNIEARDAYRTAATRAQLAGDIRLQTIAEAHLIEVSWIKLSEIGASEASKRLESAVNILKTFEGNAWALRVTRDMLLLRAHALLGLNTTDILQVYKEAWETAIMPPLHPAYGSDARKAAAILAEYIVELVKNDQTLEAIRVSVNAKDYIQQWLNHVIDPLTRETWIDEVRQYGTVT